MESAPQVDRDVPPFEDPPSGQQRPADGRALRLQGALVELVPDLHADDLGQGLGPAQCLEVSG